MIEPKDIKSTKLVLRPCYSIRGKQHILADAIKPAVYKLNEKLELIEIPEFIGKLSPVQRKVIAAASTSSTTPEIYSKTGLDFTTVNSTVSNLARQGLIKLEGKNIKIHPAIKQLGEIRGFSAKPEYVDLPGEKQRAKLSPANVSELLKSLNIDTSNVVLCYMPFYKVELAGGKTKMVDALSYSLEI